MKRVLSVKRGLTGALLLLLVGLAGILGRGWTQSGLAKGQATSLPAVLAYSDTLALVQFSLDAPAAQESPLAGPCGPVTLTLQDAQGQTLATSGGQNPGAAFQACQVAEDGVSHYTVLFWGDFRQRPPSRVVLRPASQTDGEPVFVWQGFRTAAYAPLQNRQAEGLRVEDALKTDDRMVLRVCARLPDAGDWHPRGTLRLEDGSVWAITATGVPDFRQAGALGQEQRCYIALLEKTGAGPASAAKAQPAVLEVQWQRSLPECFSPQDVEQHLAPYFRAHGQTPAEVGLVEVNGAWCFPQGQAVDAAFWDFLQTTWQQGPTQRLVFPAAP